MIKPKCVRKKISYFLCFTLLLSLFVSLFPLSNVFASDSSDSTYVIGSPMTSDGRTNSSDYADINNYYDLLLRAFWEGLGNLLVEHGYEAPTLVSCDNLLRFYIPYYIDLWEDENSFSPTYLCNIYVSYDFDSTNPFVNFGFIFVDDSSVNVSPFSYLSSVLRVPNYPTFAYNYNRGYLPLTQQGVFSSNPVVSTQSSTITEASLLREPYVILGFGAISSISLPFTSLPSSYLGSYSYPLSTGFWGAYRPRVENPLVTSFPIYLTDSERQYCSVSSRAIEWEFSINQDYIFNLTEDYVVYSEFRFYIYPTPTPFPTALPTVTPTPLPLAYDSSIDDFNSGETLGFLYSLKAIFESLLSVFSAIPFINDSVLFLYTYVPHFSFLLFIPLLAFLSFLIGRNKS